MGKIISAPSILTLSDVPASVKIKSDAKTGHSKFKDYYSVKLLPKYLKNGLVKLQVDGEFNFSFGEAQERQMNHRKISSTFVVKPGHLFSFDIQGGSSPLVLDFLVTSK